MVLVGHGDTELFRHQRQEHKSFLLDVKQRTSNGTCAWHDCGIDTVKLFKLLPALVGEEANPSALIHRFADGFSKCLECVAAFYALLDDKSMPHTLISQVQGWRRAYLVASMAAILAQIDEATTLWEEMPENERPPKAKALKAYCRASLVLLFEVLTFPVLLLSSMETMLDPFVRLLRVVSLNSKIKLQNSPSAGILLLAVHEDPVIRTWCLDQIMGCASPYTVDEYVRCELVFDILYRALNGVRSPWMTPVDADYWHLFLAVWPLFDKTIAIRFVELHNWSSLLLTFCMAASATAESPGAMAVERATKSRVPPRLLPLTLFTKATLLSPTTFWSHCTFAPDVWSAIMTHLFSREICAAVSIDHDNAVLTGKPQDSVLIGSVAALVAMVQSAPPAFDALWSLPIWDALFNHWIFRNADVAAAITPLILQAVDQYVQLRFGADAASTHPVLTAMGRRLPVGAPFNFRLSAHVMAMLLRADSLDAKTVKLALPKITYQILRAELFTLQDLYQRLVTVDAEEPMTDVIPALSPLWKTISEREDPMAHLVLLWAVTQLLPFQSPAGMYTTGHTEAQVNDFNQVLAQIQDAILAILRKVDCSETAAMLADNTGEVDPHALRATDMFNQTDLERMTPLFLLTRLGPSVFCFLTMSNPAIETAVREMLSTFYDGENIFERSILSPHPLACLKAKDVLAKAQNMMRLYADLLQASRNIIPIAPGLLRFMEEVWAYHLKIKAMLAKSSEDASVPAPRPSYFLHEYFECWIIHVCHQLLRCIAAWYRFHNKDFIVDVAKTTLMIAQRVVENTDMAHLASALQGHDVVDFTKRCLRWCETLDDAISDLAFVVTERVVDSILNYEMYANDIRTILMPMVLKMAARENGRHTQRFTALHDMLASRVDEAERLLAEQMEAAVEDVEAEKAATAAAVAARTAAAHDAVRGGVPAVPGSRQGKSAFTSATVNIWDQYEIENPLPSAAARARIDGRLTKEQLAARKAVANARKEGLNAAAAYAATAGLSSSERNGATGLSLSGDLQIIPRDESEPRPSRSLATLDGDAHLAHVPTAGYARSRDHQAEDPNKKPLRTLDDLFRTVLSWKTTDTKPNIKLQPVPDTFNSVKHYLDVFEPLLLVECFAQFRQSQEEFSKLSASQATGTRFVISQVSHRDAFMDIEMLAMISDTQSLGILVENDLLQLSHGESRTSDGAAGKTTNVLARATTIKQTRKAITVVATLLVKDLEGVSRLAELSHSVILGSAWSVRKVMPMNTYCREYTSLAQLPQLGVVLQILNPSNLEPPSVHPSMVTDVRTKYGVNTSQAKAIAAAVQVEEGFLLIQGPPGTGKTKTIVSLVGSLLTPKTGQAIAMPTAMTMMRQGRHVRSVAQDDNANPSKMKEKLLICAPSNAACDEIVRRLKLGVIDSHGKAFMPNIVRTGTMSSVHHDVVDVALESLVIERLKANRAFQLTNEQAAEAEQLEAALKMEQSQLAGKMDALRKLEKKLLAEKAPDEEIDRCQAELTKAHAELKQNRAKFGEGRDTRMKCMKQRDAAKIRAKHQIFKDCDVVLCTLSASGHDNQLSRDLSFSAVIIDEACQSVEPSTLIPLRLKMKKCILVGDPHQLPPTILSDKARSFKYEQSLFYRIQQASPQLVFMLDVQYRMHPQISTYPSHAFYGGKLIDGPGMDASRVSPWHQAQNSRSALRPYQFFNVVGQEARHGHAIYNVDEARAVVETINYIAAMSPDEALGKQIGVITFYKGQVKRIRELLQARFGSHVHEYVDVNSVDAFQGQEKEIIILSTVRASNNASVGFIDDKRRINVALTRARSTLILLGNQATLMRNTTWGAIVDDAKARRCLHEWRMSTVPRTPEASAQGTLPACLKLNATLSHSATLTAEETQNSADELDPASPPVGSPALHGGVKRKASPLTTGVTREDRAVPRR